MDSATVTLIDAEHGERAFAARVDGERVLASPAAVAALTGWELKPKGLCRAEVCVPVRDRDALVVDGAIDLERLGAALRVPTVLDTSEDVVAFGERAAARAEVIASGVAPDFELPDLEGRPFRFSSIGRKKKLLLAWASW